MDKIDQTEFTARVAQVLLDEGIEFDIDILDSYVKATYPDLRKCLNNCQMNIHESKLALPKGNEGNSGDFKLQAVDLFKNGKIREARTLICNSVRDDEMEDIYQWMYDNLDLFAETDEDKDKAIITIRDGLVNHTLVAVPEINLSACLIDLTS